MDGRGVDADQHLVVADLGLVDVRELERLVRAVVVLDDRLHVGPRFSLHSRLRTVYAAVCTAYASAYDVRCQAPNSNGRRRDSEECCHGAPTIRGPETRSRLSRERVLRAAIAQADAGGLEALIMRKLAEELGVAPMALYRHVANKDDLIDGMVDVVFGEIGLPPRGDRLERRPCAGGRSRSATSSRATAGRSG